MALTYIVAPIRQVADDDRPVVFLAGGISNCHDWQQHAVSGLREAGIDIAVCNPRRADFDTGDPSAAAEQVAWEYGYLRRADLILFWFPATDPAVTVQPITLLELGAAAERHGQPLAVGADPGYPRRLDVVLQLRHARPSVRVRDTLRDTVGDALDILGHTSGSPASGR